MHTNLQYVLMKCHRYRGFWWVKWSYRTCHVILSHPNCSIIIIEMLKWCSSFFFFWFWKLTLMQIEINEWRYIKMNKNDDGCQLLKTWRRFVGWAKCFNLDLKKTQSMVFLRKWLIWKSLTAFSLYVFYSSSFAIFFCFVLTNEKMKTVKKGE